MIELRCGQCGSIHGRVTEEAKNWVAEAKRGSVARGDTPNATLSLYRQCFQCRADSEDFVLAGREDATPGCSIQPAIIPTHLQ